MGQAALTARAVIRHAIPLAIGFGCCWALFHQLRGIEFTVLWSSLKSVSIWQWLLALMATALSFFAVARYDVIAHRHFQTGTNDRRATATGATAIAIGQTVGAGAIVGTFIRWRLLPDIGFVRAAQLTAFVTITFLASWAVVTAAAVFFIPTAGVPLSVPCAVLAIAMGLAVFAFFKPVLSRAGHDIELPTLRAIVALLILCLVDTFAATGAFWILLPSSFDVSLTQLFPIYLIALGAAILSGTPGGVGPFELTTLALMPQFPEAELIATILAFRLVYYAIPTALGGIALLRPMARSASQEARQHAFNELGGTLDQKGARAELGILRQNGGAILNSEAGQCGVVRTGQTLTSIFDPLNAAEDFTQHLRKIARQQNRFVCKYKISARHALRARKTGWTVAHISDEAIVTPAEYDLKGSAFRQLRRKLRNTEKEQLEIVEQTTGFPIAEMLDISNDWECRNGGAKGLSMGQFEADYIAHQRVFLAWQNEKLAGFISCHRTTHEWCLDLIRISQHAPDGTAHRLVHEALLVAAKENAPQFSLAAAPALPDQCGWAERYLRKQYFRKAGGPGLRQFKACFNPRWKPLYIAAPGRGHLMIAALDLIRAIKQARPRQRSLLHPLPIHKNPS